MAAPGVVVVLAVLTALLLAGVPAPIVLRYAAYWFGFVALPGIAVVAVARPRWGPLAVVSVGAAVGYAIELLAWSVTAWLGVRELLWAYPSLVLAATCPVLWSRRDRWPGRRPEPAGRWWGWAVAGCALASLAGTVAWYWPMNAWPLTGPASYSVDLPNHLGWAADALHTFPPGNPSVAGIEQQYHWFIYGHLAAGAQLTGIDLPWLMFRLYLVPLLLLIPVLLAVAARAFSGLPWAGPVAALTGTVAGELALGRGVASYGCYLTCGLFSPSYLYGLVFVAALLMVVGSRLADRERGGWLLAVPLLVVATGAKVTVVPLIAGGLALAAAYSLIRRRAALLAPVNGLTIAVAVVVATQLVLYGTVSSASRVLIEPHFVHWFSPAFRAVAVLIDPQVRLGGFSTPPLAAQLAGVPFAWAVLLAPFAGAVALVRVRRNRVVQVFLLGVVLAGFGASSVFWDPSQAEFWFLVMAMPAAAVLGGWGAAWLAARVGPRGRVALLAGGLAAGAAALAVGLQQPVSARVLVLRYAVLGLVVVVLAVAGWLLTRRKATAAVVAVTVLVGVSLPHGPLQLIRPVSAYLDDRAVLLPEALPRQRPDLSPDLYAALRWIRANAGSRDVIANNNHCLTVRTPPAPPTACRDNRVFYYSAFSERRYLLESWAYTDENFAVALAARRYYLNLGTPYPGRSALNDLAFRAPTAALLDRLYREYGVRYLLADLRPPRPGAAPYRPPAALAALTDQVYAGPDASVYRLRAPADG